MFYFLKYTTVHVILIIAQPTKAYSTVRPNKYLLAKFVRSLVQPYIHSLLINATIENIGNITEKGKDGNLFSRAIEIKLGNIRPVSTADSPGAISEVPMLKFIQNKTKTLTQYLDDNTYSELDGLTLDGVDETTIIEFIPNIVSKNKSKHVKGQTEDTEKVLEFQSKIYKYKKMRNKIRKALTNEKISDETKEMVSKTIDKMIAHMKQHKCNWADDAATAQMRADGKSPPEKLVQKWNFLWENLKRNLTKSRPSLADRNGANDQQRFLSKFQELVTMMTDELNHLVSKYKIVCRFEDMHKESPKNIDRSVFDYKNPRSSVLNSDKQIKNTYSENQLCDHIQVCSEELTDYLHKFYINLNESAVSVVDNYASMFLRDVSDDGYKEKERIVDMIRKTCKVIEIKVDMLFRSAIMKLELDDKKNQYANMRILNNFLKTTIDDAKVQIPKEITSGLFSVRPKVLDNIIRDIEVNLNSEMTLLEKKFNERMCPIFDICNGRIYKTRKANKYSGHRNNVFVKLHHGPDEARSISKTTKTTIKNLKIFWTKSQKVIVTRTTPGIGRLRARIEPTANVTSEINNDEKNSDIGNVIDISKKNAGPRNQSNNETRRSIFNVYAMKIVKEIKSNTIGNGSHEGEISDTDQETLTDNDLPETFVTDTAKDLKGQSLGKHVKVVEVTIRKEPFDYPKDRIRQSRINLKPQIRRNQRNLVIYRK